MTVSGGDRRYPAISPRGKGGAGLAREILNEVDALLGTSLVDSQRERLWRIQAHARALLAVAEGPTPAPPTRRLRILLVEDNPFNQELMSRLLTVRGHTVRVAEDAAAALRLLMDFHPELILVDLRPPELGGLAACRAVRRHEQTVGGHVPIIAVTAITEAQEREQAIDAGVDDFHGKPIQADLLFAEIEELLRGRSTGSSSAPTAPPAVLSEEGDALPLVDLDKALRGVDGDWSLLEEVADLYFSEAPRQLAVLREQIRERNGEMVREVAHSLKGASGAFGKGITYQLSLEIEQLGRAGELAQAEQRWQELHEALGRMEEHLRKILKEGRS